MDPITNDLLVDKNQAIWNPETQEFKVVLEKLVWEDNLECDHYEYYDQSIKQVKASTPGLPGPHYPKDSLPELTEARFVDHSPDHKHVTVYLKCVPNFIQIEFTNKKFAFSQCYRQERKLVIGQQYPKGQQFDPTQEIFYSEIYHFIRPYEPRPHPSSIRFKNNWGFYGKLR